MIASLMLVPEMSQQLQQLGLNTSPQSQTALVQAVCMVSVAELFDKTWFAALVLAMMHNKIAVFCGAYLGLFLHTLIAALFGFGISRFFSASGLHLMAGCLYLCLAVLYGRECLLADKDGDVIAAGREEASEELNIRLPANKEEGAYGSAEKGEKPGSLKLSWTRVFIQSFVAVFIAEWGDRTQIAMIGQHASQPLIPVVIGSAIAFFLLTLSAVLLGMLLEKVALTERMVYAVSTVSFLVFAALALKDSYMEHASALMGIPLAHAR